MPKTKPQANPRRCRPIGELIAAAAGTQTTCPDCKRDRAFYVTRSRPGYEGQYRNRVCRFCGHVQQELAPKPVIVQETAFVRD